MGIVKKKNETQGQSKTLKVNQKAGCKVEEEDREKENLPGMMKTQEMWFGGKPTPEKTDNDHPKKHKGKKAAFVHDKIHRDMRFAYLSCVASMLKSHAYPDTGALSLLKIEASHPLAPKQLFVAVLNSDPLDAVHGMRARCLSVCVVSACNAYTPGGGWRRGVDRPEERIFRRTTLACSLELLHRAFYPLTCTAAVYSPYVLVWADAEEEHPHPTFGCPC